MPKKIKKDLKIREADRKILRDRYPSDKLQHLIAKIQLDSYEIAKLQAMSETWGLSRVFLGNSTIPLGIFLTLASFTVMHIVVASLGLVLLLVTLGIVFGTITYSAAIEDKHKEIEDFKMSLLIAKADLLELNAIRGLEEASLQDKLTKLQVYIQVTFSPDEGLALPEDFMSDEAITHWIDKLKVWSNKKLTLADKEMATKKNVIDEWLKQLEASLISRSKMNQLTDIKQPTKFINLMNLSQWSSIWNNRYWATIATFVGNFLSVLGTWATISAIAKAIVLTAPSHVPLILYWAAPIASFMTGGTGFLIAFSLSLATGIMIGSLYYWSLIKSEQRKAYLEELHKQVTIAEDICNQNEEKRLRLSNIKKYLHNIVDALVSEDVGLVNLEAKQFLKDHVETLVQVPDQRSGLGSGTSEVVAQTFVKQDEGLERNLLLNKS